MDDSKLGTDFFTYEQAAEHLKCSTRTIKNYIKRGYLEKVLVSGRPRVTRDSVNRKYNESGIAGPPFDRYTVTRLHLELKDVRHRLAKIEFTLGLHQNPLHLNKVTAQSLYSTAKLMVEKMDEFEFQVIEKWADIIGGLDEEGMGTLSEVVVTSRPWEPFRALERKMVKYLSQSQFAGSPDAQHLKGKVIMAGERLLSISLLWALPREGQILEVPPDQTLREIMVAAGIGPRVQRVIQKAM